ncbi:hypothetical protein QQ020_05730 [Fulvivirgaceae bacterium BMA12]|uniref:Uncharacterized protein n=1 Tax=Agaribacillus aureus TaxID=3051825 RepID=A0ABT8L1B6_9BACT|nr:hypothetical protein [Fulvivirgaceae bacterium BMA12]
MKTLLPEFTHQELIYLQDTDFLKTKKLIIRRIIALFERIQVDTLDLISHRNLTLPEGVSPKSGKVTRGENYKDLPFVVLDCPRFFDKKNIFAYRSIFWWGNYLSNHFLIKGHYLDRYRDRFLHSRPLIEDEELYLDLSEDPWNHDLTDSNFIRFSALSQSELNEKLKHLDFLKLVWRYELSQWKEFHQASLENFLIISQVLEL